MKRLSLWPLPLAALLLLVTGADAANPAQEIKWAELVPPPALAEPGAPKPKTFFEGATPAGANAAPPQPMPEGKFMQTKRRQPGAGNAQAVVAALDGKRVKIDGYVVPLDFDATKVKEFLLVPFVGACIHVPPPPANQIVYVKIENGFDVSGSFDPVSVTGTIRTTVAFTGLADAGYSLDAETVTARQR